MTRAADVIVVGAGPAGAATAILLAEHGLAVTVLERVRRSRPKICGEYLSPEAGRVLDRLGALKAVDAGGAVALAGMRITAPDGTVLAARYGVVGGFRPYREHAIGVSRATLDGALLDRGPPLPVDLRGGGRAPDRVNLSLVVPLAHAVPWCSRLEDFFAARVKHLPHLARRLAEARRVAPLQSMAPLAYRVTLPREGGVLFVGDAAGFYDPFTGEGIFTALRSAELAADTLVAALRAGDVSAAALAAYGRARRAAFADKERATRALQALIGRRRLANLAARCLAARPRVLDALLGVIGDYVPPRALPRLLVS